MITIQAISKRYVGASRDAIHDIWFQEEPGKIVGLLGPNGAGKSTLIKILVGLLEADQGEVSYQLDEERDIGYVPEDQLSFHYLTGLDFLRFIGGIRGLSQVAVAERIEAMNPILNLPDLNALISTYSNGNKQKILFLSALLHQPKLLVLDEPFNGFDPAVIANLRQFLLDYAQAGNLILFSSHILDTVSEICHRILVIDGGQVVADFDDGIRHGRDQLETMYLQIVRRVAQESEPCQTCD